MMEGVSGVGYLLIGDEGDTNLAGGDGSDVGLTVFAPVDLDETGPGGDVEVLTKTDAAGADVLFRETCPDGYSRTRTVGAYDEAGMKCLAVRVYENPFDRAGDALHGVFPVKANTKAGGVVEQDLMEDRATNPTTYALRKSGFGRGIFADEADAMDGMAFEAAEIFLDINADGEESLKGVGHETFPADFIYRRFDGVDKIDLKALPG